MFKRDRSVAYDLKLPKEFAMIHPLFHVFVIKKCIGDPVSILPLEGLGGKGEVFICGSPDGDVGLPNYKME